ncbi:symmetrical bis(5'-nucleosyl)-tetraphosphatase [Thauera aminoaromatica]|uniref:Bis(5'-nucleosyl)-tetraphosphatase, symmetrical n=1 Tax=Thauera aminoaromatica TaxID=164330 RepID=A0A5C7SRE6_THASP|nr:symmetrical bis(5'-nucleosyl)-tetraphosphatase [Thauera aminoaromatica]TXH85415.1 MAG: symmetrical bis(5'-nucleosyl)-tetraphosphatase [Thauera aminoaromatica]
MATYAIGDIQGCFTSLMALLKRVDFDPARDRLWLVGDLVNRGPDSLRTLRFVRELGPAAVTVLGNHDLYLLMVAYGAVRSRGKDDTIQAVLDAPDRDGLLGWLRTRPLMHVEDGFAMVHAGLLPNWTVTQARALAREVEGALAGPYHADLLHNMWGSEPAAWSSDLRDYARMRVIVNAMTRMRFCTPDGQMDFKVKGEVTKAPKGFVPWFEVPGRKSADTTVVFGHWSALGLRVEPRLLALDSGCLWGRELSAVRLEDRAVFQVACPGLSHGKVKPS